jgi:hypothetical protein
VSCAFKACPDAIQTRREWGCWGAGTRRAESSEAVQSECMLSSASVPEAGRARLVNRQRETNSLVMIQTLLPVCWFMCDVTRREGEERMRGEGRVRKRRGHEPAKRVEHCEHSKCNEFLFESLGLLQAQGPPRFGTPTPAPGTLARTNNRVSHPPWRDLAKSGTLESPESRNTATPPNPRTLTPPSFGIW